MITLNRNRRHLVICLVSYPMGIGGLRPRAGKQLGYEGDHPRAFPATVKNE